MAAFETFQQLFIKFFGGVVIFEFDSQNQGWLLTCAIIDQAGFKTRYFQHFGFFQGFGISHGKLCAWFDFITKVLYFASQNESAEIVRSIGRTNCR